MKKRIIALFLLCIFLFLAACGEKALGDAENNNNGNGNTQNDASNTVETGGASTAGTERPYPAVSGKDYGGYEFNIIHCDHVKSHTWVGVPDDIYVEAENGDLINDVVYSRNAKVEEILNVKIIGTAVSSSEIMNKLNQTVLSGDEVYGAISQDIVQIAPLVEGNLLYNLYDLDLDFTYPWWDGKSIEQFSIAGKLFCAESDITFIDKLATIVVFYNKSIAENNGIGELYATVSAGDWTLNKMLEYAAGVSSDVNGDGIMDKEDVYGISCQNDGSYYFLHSAGIRLCEKDASGGLKFSLNSEKSLGAMQDIFILMNNKNLYFNAQTQGAPIADILRLFAADKALFLVRPAQSLFGLRDMQADFGIIPMPKYYDDQEAYYSPMNNYPGTIFAVPKLVGDPERTSVIIETLAAESHYQVMGAFYDVVLGTKLTRDEASAEMLDIVYGNRIFDLGMIWDFGKIRTTIVVSNVENVASKIASIENQINEDIKRFTDSVK